MNNIRVTQTINVKIKDVEHNLTFAEATALYNTLGSVLNLGKTSTAEERKERHDSGLFPNHMCTFV